MSPNHDLIATTLAKRLPKGRFGIKRSAGLVENDGSKIRAETDAARVGGEKSHEHFQKRRLARAVGADEADFIPAHDARREIGNDEPLAEGLWNVLRFDDERKSISDVIQPTNIPGLDVVPAHLVLQEYEYDVPLAISSKKGEDGRQFYMRIASALKQAEDKYDVVVIDCPPQLGYLTITALMASTGILITIHPQMLDIMSMSQFLMMLGGIMGPVAEAGDELRVQWIRYLITRFEPTDIPQSQMVGFMQSMFAQQMLRNHVLKSTAISDASIKKQTLYEVERGEFVRATYDRAIESLNAANAEIVELIHGVWGRK